MIYHDLLFQLVILSSILIVTLFYSAIQAGDMVIRSSGDRWMMSRMISLLYLVKFWAALVSVLLIYNSSKAVSVGEMKL